MTDSFDECAHPHAVARLSRLPHLRTPGLEPRPERERGDRAGGMGEGLPVLRCDEGMEVIIGECHSRLP